MPLITTRALNALLALVDTFLEPSTEGIATEVNGGLADESGRLIEENKV